MSPFKTESVASPARVSVSEVVLSVSAELFTSEARKSVGTFVGGMKIGTCASGHLAVISGNFGWMLVIFLNQAV